MKSSSKTRKVLLGILLAAVVALTVFAIAFKIYTGNYYKADEESISHIQEMVSGNVSEYGDKDVTVFIPENQEIKAVIVFYPGGKVEYTAYSGLMYELADRGFLCVLPRMPENLAFLRVNAVDMLKNHYAKEVELVEGIDWYLAGHSLGGVAASTYLGSHMEDFSGLILCASYTTCDFSDSDLRLLSIYGSEDKVLKMDSYESSKVNWPKDAEEEIILGGIHSYFGNYGIQDGDGEPQISNEEQILQAADIISAFCSD